MSDGHRVDVALRGAAGGIAVVVAATAGYLSVLLAFAWSAAWILRVV